MKYLYEADSPWRHPYIIGFYSVRIRLIHTKNKPRLFSIPYGCYDCLFYSIAIILMKVSNSFLIRCFSFLIIEMWFKIIEIYKNFGDLYVMVHMNIDSWTKTEFVSLVMPIIELSNRKRTSLALTQRISWSLLHRFYFTRSYIHLFYKHIY